MRSQVGSVVVEETLGGNLRISAAHRGGIIRDLGDGREVIIERADRFDLLAALTAALTGDIAEGKDKHTDQAISRAFVDRAGGVHSLAIVTHAHGWDAQLDGEPLTLGAFRDICALLEATR